MPVMTIRLTANEHSEAELNRLLVEASKTYAHVLECPVDRVRVYVDEYPPQRVIAGGQLATRQAPAPYFDFIVLKGRPLAQRHSLLEKFTLLIAEVLSVEAAEVRGMCREVDADNWAIGGQTASVKRRAEIAARASAGN